MLMETSALLLGRNRFVNAVNVIEVQPYDIGMFNFGLAAQYCAVLEISSTGSNFMPLFPRNFMSYHAPSQAHIATAFHHD